MTFLAWFILSIVVAGSILVTSYYKHQATSRHPDTTDVASSAAASHGAVHGTPHDWGKWQSKVIWLLTLGVLLFISSRVFNFDSNDLFSKKKTLELEVSTLEPHKLCGVRPGERKFTIPHQSFILMYGDNYEVTSYIRVNGSLPNESFTVESNGCVQVSFAFNSRALGKPIDPQVIQITFK
ncbi:MAG: hypothetical protein WAV46_00340 [Candidatus Moraniibacteriota bacterium]